MTESTAEKNRPHKPNAIDFKVNIQNIPEEQVGEEIIRHLIKNRLTLKKPEIIFIAGGSGEGKSYAAIKIADIVNRMYDIKTVDYLKDMIVYTPLEYSEKVRNILNEKRLKDLHVLIIDEARETVKATLWNSLINRAISDINAMSRAIKRLVIIIVSQSFRDVDKSLRYTITHYCDCSRPSAGASFLRIYTAYQDTYEIDSPKLKKRKLRGILKTDTTRKYISISSFRVSKLEKEIVDAYEEQSFVAKHSILMRKMDELQKTINKDVGVENSHLDAIINYYSTNIDALNEFLIKKRGKTKFDEKFKMMYNLTTSEMNDLEKKLFEIYQEKGFMALNENKKKNTEDTNQQYDEEENDELSDEENKELSDNIEIKEETEGENDNV